MKLALSTTVGARAWRLAIVVFLTISALLQYISAGEVKLSFLNNLSALTNTFTILTDNGCGQDSVTALRRVIERFYEEPCEFDRSKLPKPDNGFYTFKSMDATVQALPQKLHEAKHSYGLNCYDTVILIAGDSLRIALSPDDNFGPFVVSKQLTNGSEVIRFAATPRDAISISYAEWYRNETEPIFPIRMRDARIGLVAEIYRLHLLPKSTTKTTMQEQVWKALKSDWHRAGLHFPDKFQVVLYHMAGPEGFVDVPMMVNTPHAGVLFKRKSGFTYLEKIGGAGPFVRLDFDDKAELIIWMSHTFSHFHNDHVALSATFNDTEIVSFNSK